jgi:hypothetical protein
MDADPGVFLSVFTCDGEDSARRVANAVLVTGLAPELRAPRLPGEQWQVVAPAELVPTPANLAELREEMQALAERVGATYDGLFS